MKVGWKVFSMVEMLVDMMAESMAAVMVDGLVEKTE